MSANLDHVVLPEQDYSEVMAAIAIIREKLPFLLNLSVDERRVLPRMGDKTRIFIQKAMELANRDAAFLPRSFDLAEMRREVDLYEQLYPILMSLAQLHELVEHTYLIAGDEAYSAARSVYKSAQVNGRGIGVEAVVDELGRRFRRKPRRPQLEENVQESFGGEQM